MTERDACPGFDIFRGLSASASPELVWPMRLFPSGNQSSTPTNHPRKDAWRQATSWCRPSSASCSVTLTEDVMGEDGAKNVAIEGSRETRRTALQTRPTYATLASSPSPIAHSHFLSRLPSPSPCLPTVLLAFNLSLCTTARPNTFIYPKKTYATTKTRSLFSFAAQTPITN
jgi:hypothetical protein